MKPLNRPMFQRGGKVSSRNNGIVSGFENGGSVRQGFKEAGYVDIIDEYIKEPERQQGLSTSDYLRIASAGADIMGAQPTGRSGFIGALQAAGPSLGSLGRDLGTSMNAREAAYQDQLNKRNLTKTKKTQTLLKLLKDRGFTFNGKDFKNWNIKNILTNPFYVGDLNYSGIQTTHKYERIISRRLFNQV